ncbi:hypothetical protein [Kamptonema sp. UHCC 0994]|uniref:hypothetical protein n=1 Tax=Kamptonema sp. UHCC 0994 TaxID=3031329 RepID=UPI0023BB1A70|nr:hypothetical protein [Kamptonema sp. UHCC 0994]MDF0557003.1 hypothetical protein [Kamptonema sp. UHCC 0994]
MAAYKGDRAICTIEVKSKLAYISIVGYLPIACDSSLEVNVRKTASISTLKAYRLRIFDFRF